MDISSERVDEILLDHCFDVASLIAMLQEIQEDAGYLPAPALTQLSETLGVPLPRIRALSTFYKSFSLVPTGRHKVGVCMGTACHVRGGSAVLDSLVRELGVKAGATTPDRRFTLETVRCLGCCALAPVVRIDTDVHGRLNQLKATRRLKRYE